MSFTDQTIATQTEARRQATIEAAKVSSLQIANNFLPPYDPSLASPEQQQQYLADMLAGDDAASPAPFTGSPPWGEPVDLDEYIPDSVLAENYEVAPDVEAAAEADLVYLTSDSRGMEEFPAPDWYNDPQYHGLGVPPGVENFDQPIESGHTQINLPNPSAEHGWDAWTGRPQLARVARHENNFPQYSAGTSRGHMLPVEKFVEPRALQTQMYRDMLLSELKKRGVHSAVVTDVPSVPYTQEVVQIDPTALVQEAPIGPEGVLA